MSRLSPSTVAKMDKILAGRDPKSMRFRIVHTKECPSQRGDSCLCDPTVVGLPIKPKESKATRRMRRKNT